MRLGLGTEEGGGVGEGAGVEGRQRGGGEVQGKPAVTALALISRLQSWLEREPARVCALLTQAGKTFLSSSEERGREKQGPTTSKSLWTVSWHPESGAKPGSTGNHSILLKLSATIG